MERYRRGVHSSTKKTDKVDFKTKIIRQSIICGAIFLVVLGISLLKTTTAEKLSERIGYSLSYTVDYKSTLIDIVDKVKELGATK